MYSPSQWGYPMMGGGMPMMPFIVPVPPEKAGDEKFRQKIEKYVIAQMLKEEKLEKAKRKKFDRKPTMFSFGHTVSLCFATAPFIAITYMYILDYIKQMALTLVYGTPQ